MTDKVDRKQAQLIVSVDTRFQKLDILDELRQDFQDLEQTCDFFIRVMLCERINRITEIPGDDVEKNPETAFYQNIADGCEDSGEKKNSFAMYTDSSAGENAKESPIYWWRIVITLTRASDYTDHWHQKKEY